MRRFGEDYVRGLGMSAHNNALAYGYSVTATASFAVLVATAGSPDVGHIFSFVLGTSLAFAGVNALVTRGFRSRVEEEPPVVLALATSLSALSISAAVGVAALLGWGLGGWLSWALGHCSPRGPTCRSPRSRSRSRALHLSVGGKEPGRR
jgi:hypothetical protein